MQFCHAPAWILAPVSILFQQQPAWPAEGFTKSIEKKRDIEWNKHPLKFRSHLSQSRSFVTCMFGHKVPLSERKLIREFVDEIRISQLLVLGTLQGTVAALSSRSCVALDLKPQHSPGIFPDACMLVFVCFCTSDSTEKLRSL